MARFTFKLPDIGEGIAEAEIVAWHVAVGDRVEEDQNIADMMTDKATVEMESPVSGTVVALAGEVGDQVAIGAALVVIETEGDVSAEEAPALGPVSDEAKAAPPSADQQEVAEQYEVENPGVEEAHAAGMTTPARSGEGAALPERSSGRGTAPEGRGGGAEGAAPPPSAKADGPPPHALHGED